MRRYQFLILLLSIFVLPSTYAGCYRQGLLTWYWDSPTVEISANYTKTQITSSDKVGERIGTLSIKFNCKSTAGNWYWNYDNYMGGYQGNIFIPLPDFNTVDTNKMVHKSGLVYIQTDDGNRWSSFLSPDGNAWSSSSIYFSSFKRVMKENGWGPLAIHRYGIYINKVPRNVMSGSEVIRFLTSASGFQINYRAGGNSPKNQFIRPSLSGNDTKVDFKNTVTCSVTNNFGNNIDLGTVNIRGDFNKPLTTLLLTMRCGYGVSGGNMTSNYPEFIVPGSTYLTIGSPDALGVPMVDGNFIVNIGNGWGLKFDYKGTQIVNINNFGRISIPVFPYKFKGASGNGADWKGAVNIIISYN